MSEQAPETTPARRPATFAEEIELRKLDQEDRRIALEEGRLSAALRAQRTPAEAAFELEQRMATTLAGSPFLPENVARDAKGRVAAAWGVLRYAALLGVDPYALAQVIYVVHGRVGFGTAFLVGLVNARAGLRQPIDWTVTGEGAGLTVTCTATDADGRDRRVVMTRAEVDKWGWANKSEPWKADPALMMRYRTAAKLIRLYFAGFVAGLTFTKEELIDSVAEVAATAPALVDPAPPPRQIPTGTAARTVEDLLGPEPERVPVEAARPATAADVEAVLDRLPEEAVSELRQSVGRRPTDRLTPEELAGLHARATAILDQVAR